MKFWRNKYTDLCPWSWDDLEALGRAGHHTAGTDNSSSVGGHGAARGCVGGDLRAQIHSLHKGWADGGGHVLGSEGFPIVWFLPSPASSEEA